MSAFRLTKTAGTSQAGFGFLSPQSGKKAAAASLHAFFHKHLARPAGTPLLSDTGTSFHAFKYFVPRTKYKGGSGYEGMTTSTKEMIYTSCYGNMKNLES